MSYRFVYGYLISIRHVIAVYHQVNCLIIPHGLTLKMYNDQQRSIRGRKEDPVALSDEAQNNEYLFLCERMDAPPYSSVCWSGKQP